MIKLKKLIVPGIDQSAAFKGIKDNQADLSEIGMVYVWTSPVDHN